jgi:hypothetical protein
MEAIRLGYNEWTNALSLSRTSKQTFYNLLTKLENRDVIPYPQSDDGK